MSREMLLEKQKHKIRFMEIIYNACKDMGMTVAEYDSSEESFDEQGDYSDPEADAESNMSYWEE